MPTAADVQDWLTQTQQMGLTDPAYLYGIAVLEQLLVALPRKKPSYCRITPIHSTQKHGYPITSPTLPMSKSPSMTQEAKWCGNWSWCISLPAITPIGQKRRIGMDATKVGNWLQAGSISITCQQGTIPLCDGW